MNKYYYTTKEVLKLLKIHKDTLYWWRRKNAIPFVCVREKHILKKYYYPKAQIDELIKK